jgi:hypothetical protein
MAAAGLNLCLANYDTFKKLFNAPTGKLCLPHAARLLICIGVLALLWNPSEWTSTDRGTSKLGCGNPPGPITTLNSESL